MTTANFLRLQPMIGAALAIVKNTHCAPPAFKPDVDVASSITCPACKSHLPYTVSASNGLTSGRCTAACGVKWDAQ